MQILSRLKYLLKPMFSVFPELSLIDESRLIVFALAFNTLVIFVCSQKTAVAPVFRTYTHLHMSEFV